MYDPFHCGFSTSRRWLEPLCANSLQGLTGGKFLYMGAARQCQRGKALSYPCAIHVYPCGIHTLQRMRETTDHNRNNTFSDNQGYLSQEHHLQSKHDGLSHSEFLFHTVKSYESKPLSSSQQRFYVVVGTWSDFHLVDISNDGETVNYTVQRLSNVSTPPSRHVFLYDPCVFHGDFTSPSLVPAVFVPVMPVEAMAADRPCYTWPESQRLWLSMLDMFRLWIDCVYIMSMSML